MFAVLAARPRHDARWLEWLPVALGLLVLYVPTFYGLSTSLWRSEDHAHGPIILAVIIWLAWRRRDALIAAPVQAAPLAGIPMAIVGLLLYVVGRSQDIDVFQVGALLPILGGTLLAMRGRPALCALWFPLLFVVFLVPFPAVYVDTVTGPLKQAVSAIAEQLLYAAGYPVARNGVILSIGKYQLLVADACSGLNSMISLSALGLLYLYLQRRKGWVHNGIVLFSILPIAFAANVIRVLVLVLVTFHIGDAAGQGFLHGAAGVVLVAAALSLILFLDAMLVVAMKPRNAVLR